MTPVSDLFAAEAIRLVGKSLRKAVANGSDLEARTDMLLANTLESARRRAAGQP